MFLTHVRAFSAATRLLTLEPGTKRAHILWDCLGGTSRAATLNYDETCKLLCGFTNNFRNS